MTGCRWVAKQSYSMARRGVIHRLRYGVLFLPRACVDKKAGSCVRRLGRCARAPRSPEFSFPAVDVELCSWQVRSLGSHAAEAKDLRQARRLDIFALDLLEEWTALHGSMVWRQVKRVRVLLVRVVSACHGCLGGPLVLAVTAASL